MIKNASGIERTSSGEERPTGRNGRGWWEDNLDSSCQDKLALNVKDLELLEQDGW